MRPCIHVNADRLYRRSRRTSLEAVVDAETSRVDWLDFTQVNTPMAQSVAKGLPVARAGKSSTASTITPRFKPVFMDKHLTALPVEQHISAGVSRAQSLLALARSAPESNRKGLHARSTRLPSMGNAERLVHRGSYQGSICDTETDEPRQKCELLLISNRL